MAPLQSDPPSQHSSLTYPRAGNISGLLGERGRCLSLCFVQTLNFRSVSTGRNLVLHTGRLQTFC